MSKTFPFIRLLGERLGSNSSYIENQVSAAAAMGATQDATFERDGKWNRVADCVPSVAIELLARAVHRGWMGSSDAGEYLLNMLDEIQPAAENRIREAWECVRAGRLPGTPRAEFAQAAHELFLAEAAMLEIEAARETAADWGVE